MTIANRLIVRCVVVFAIIPAASSPGGQLAFADAVIRNGVVWHGTQGKEIWSNGGHMIREGDTFYWVGYETAPGRAWNINVYSSSDLANWKFENNVIQKRGPFAILGWAGRPALLHNRATGKYVIVFEADSRQWNRHKLGFAVCDTISGRYEHAGYYALEGTRSTGDQSVFQEGDKAYLVCTMDKDIDGTKYLNQSLAIFRLKPDYLSIGEKVFEGFDDVNGRPSNKPRHHTSREASHIIKVGDTYYWFSSGLQGWNSTETKYATAKSLEGPWSDLKVLLTDPNSRDSFNTQHDFVIPVAGSETTTYVYVGDRYSQWTRKGTGRNIFLPLIWKEGIPTLKWYDNWQIDVKSGEFQAVKP